MVLFTIPYWLPGSSWFWLSVIPLAIILVITSFFLGITTGAALLGQDIEEIVGAIEDLRHIPVESKPELLSEPTGPNQLLMEFAWDIAAPLVELMVDASILGIYTGLKNPWMAPYSTYMAQWLPILGVAFYGWLIYRMAKRIFGWL